MAALSVVSFAMERRVEGLGSIMSAAQMFWPRYVQPVQYTSTPG